MDVVSEIDVTKFFPLVTKIASRYYGMGMECEELQAEGRRGLVAALNFYNGKTQFYHYCKFWIKKYIKEYVRLHLRKANNLSSSEENLEPYNSKEDSYPERLMKKMTSILDVNYLMNNSNLSDTEKEVINYRFGLKDKEKNLKEVGAILQCSGERVRQMEEGALSKMYFSYMRTNYNGEL